MFGRTGWVGGSGGKTKRSQGEERCRGGGVISRTVSGMLAPVELKSSRATHIFTLKPKEI